MNRIVLLKFSLCSGQVGQDEVPRTVLRTYGIYRQTFECSDLFEHKLIGYTSWRELICVITQEKTSVSL